MQTDTTHTVNTAPLRRLHLRRGRGRRRDGSTIGDDPADEDASLGPDTNIHSAGTAVTVKATRGASAMGADGGAGGILAGGAELSATSTVSGAIKAYVEGGAKVGTSRPRPVAST